MYVTQKSLGQAFSIIIISIKKLLIKRIMEMGFSVFLWLMYGESFINFCLLKNKPNAC